MKRKSHWRGMAEELQREALAALPSDASFQEKSRAIRDAWPDYTLGERSRWPYKMWLIVRRENLGLPKAPTRFQREKNRKAKAALQKRGLVQGQLF